MRVDHTGPHVGLAEDDNDGQVAQQPRGTNHRGKDLLQYVLGPDLDLGDWRTGTVSQVEMSFHQGG